jgi:cell division protein FtsB
MINMDLETHKQKLASLDVNPDEIENNRYATAFRIQFAIIEEQNEEIDALKTENQKFRDEINLLKGEQDKSKIRGSKKSEDVSSEKERQKRKPL